MSPPSLLIVEDDPVSRRLLDAVLRPEGYRLYFADNGPEALQVAAEVVPELVLLDVMLPQMDGFEVCERLRAMRREEFFPIILVTALDRTSDRLRGFQAGADDFITKPFNGAELRARVKAFLRIQQQQVELADNVRRLNELENLRDRLLALLVHDLRGPLSSIMGNLELILEEQGLPPLVLESADDAYASGRRLLRLISDVLDVTRLEENRLPVKPVLSDPVAAARDALQALSGIARRRNAVVEVVASGAPERFAFDHDILARTIENLLVNALSVSPPNEKVTIVVSLDAGGNLCISVQDRGPGIPHDMKRSIFDRYAQVKQERRGYGLGLYFCRLAIEAHRGTIAVRDREGGGSSFEIFLPAAEPGATGAGSGTGTSAGAGAGAARHRPDPHRS
ncbi:MAG TPA: hybrid sensor histidine kinase/response regulator [Myxococcota bacterium]|nr:hybrid sensor histidine kinase/response regulator [Myxococcota bacterium]